MISEGYRPWLLHPENTCTLNARFPTRLMYQCRMAGRAQPKLGTYMYNREVGHMLRAKTGRVNGRKRVLSRRAFMFKC